MNRNHILSTPEGRLARRAYEAILGDPKKGPCIFGMVPSGTWKQTAIGWTEALGTKAAKKAVKEDALPRQNKKILQAFQEKAR